jgi:hypothetical protein
MCIMNNMEPTILKIIYCEHGKAACKVTNRMENYNLRLDGGTLTVLNLPCIGGTHPTQKGNKLITVEQTFSRELNWHFVLVNNSYF